MEISQEQKEAIKKIDTGIKCAYDCKCYVSKLASVCKVKDNGADEFLECLEENVQDCEFSLSFGETSHCLCPIQIYIANNRLNK